MVIETEMPVELREKRYCLTKNAPAIQITPDGNGKLRLGTLVRLPEGAEVEICGEGFDRQTAKVVWEGANFYVFLDDLQAKQAAVQRAC